MKRINLKVLWISEKNKNGICVDKSGNEYYIDSSIKGFNELNRNNEFFAEVKRLEKSLLVVREVLTVFKSKAFSY